MSSAIMDKKFPPKLTKSTIGLGLYSSQDEIGADVTNLEREMRSLHNRLTQIECNTDQKLAALGERLQTLNKTIDSLNSNYEISTKSSDSSLDNSSNCRPCFTSTPTYNSTSANKLRWTSPLVYDRPRAGDDTDYYRPKFSIYSSLPNSLNYGGEISEASRFRTELNLREKNIAQQERELKSRRHQLLARIKSLTNQSWSDNTPSKLESTAKSTSFGESSSQNQWKNNSRSPQTQSQIVY